MFFDEQHTPQIHNWSSIAMMKKLLASTLSLTSLLVVTAVLPANAQFAEGFNSINTLAAAGWAFANTSDPGPVATSATGNWLQGNTGSFGYAAQAGAATSYIAGDVSVTDQSQTNQFTTASQWLLTPVVTFGGSFSFYTRTTNGNNRAELLELRASTSGASTNVGTAATAVGDFTNTLLTIGSSTDPTAYPGAIASTNFWQLFTVNTSSLTGSGRLAFRWFGTNAGPVPDFGQTPTNLNIGIDTASYVAVPEPSSAAGFLLVGGLGMVSRRRMAKKNA
jgi:hypothetical protein